MSDATEDGASAVAAKPRPFFGIAEGIVVLGVLTVCGGIWLVYPPMAIVVGGLALIGAGLGLALMAKA